MKQKLLNNECIYAGTYHHIKSDCAINLVREFILRFGDFARTSNIGGLFSTLQLRNFGIGPKNISSVERGVMTYLCLSNTTPPKISIAVIKTYKEMDFPGDYGLPPHSLLLMSSDPFVYSSPGTSFNDVRSFIQNEKSPIYENNTEVLYRDVEPLTANFQKYFPSENEYPYGFLRHDEEKDLLSQPAPPGNPIVGIRWLLGYDSEEEVNRIRVVFFAVLQNGESMLHKIDNTSDAVILEKSWPPFD